MASFLLSNSNSPRYTSKGKLARKYYERELRRLQEELAMLQRWITSQGLRVLVICEGRDAAGKGGVIKRIVERLNPRGLSGGGAGSANRTGAEPVVFPAVCGASSRCRGDGALRPELVQPGRSRAGDGVLHRAGISRVSSVLSPV